MTPDVHPVGGDDRVVFEDEGVKIRLHVDAFRHPAAFATTVRSVRGGMERADRATNTVGLW